ncbi:ABC transporter substrate-binding protein [Candidatus Mycobacterium wuenschmannii]|uniref:ABC transporter substrate-binding protein n=1 Tax=Candidatus Mycobacterium wuenschmannii TaxID=3027808 RepID=A0ABY8VVZ3_9MYCO|nr:ABC transporter substrate-binding protein [Candidatus Mycobacterium wuenschmannii]WIM87810.1 ABC transporter substrate-binding protein [Candidatus Mycobacterium wuenschmannii]
MSRRAWVALMVSAWLPVACATHPTTTAHPGRDCITDFRSGADYFPDKSTVVDATNFTLSYHDSYQVLTVKQPYPHGKSQSYVLVRCGAPAPELSGDLAGAQRITVPVAGLYSGSITQLGMLAELDRTDTVTGVADAAGVVDPQLRQRISSGAVVGYATGNQLNIESVVAAHPDVLVTAGIDQPAYPKLRDAGVPVLADAEWLEATPLGRAEWIKVLAALTGTEKKAGEAYAALRGNYAAVAAKTSGARPVEVLTGAMYQGTWFMPSGADYAGRLIVDAGGSYPWASDTSGGSLQLNFESVYARAGQAPTWLVANDWKTTGDAIADDNRYGELAAVRGGQVWSATGAGSDYWERGPARPDLVLGDLVAILHPELAAQHEFSFYRQVQRA